MMTSLSSELLERVASGERVTRADLELLSQTSDLIALGMAADAVRRRIHGDRATFVRVLDLTADDVLADTAEGTWPTAGEIRIRGGADPDALVRAVAIAARRAGGTPVTAASLGALASACSTSRQPLASVVRELAAAGMDAIAEASLDDYQDDNAELGAHLNVCVEAGVHVARLVRDHGRRSTDLALLSEIDALGGSGIIRAFAPLPRRLDSVNPTTGYDDVRSVALARLAVSSIAHIQVDWSSYGPKLAQVALTFGADDLDCVSPVDTIDLGLRRATVEEVRRNIIAASLRPAERNARFDTR